MRFNQRYMRNCHVLWNTVTGVSPSLRLWDDVPKTIVVSIVSHFFPDLQRMIRGLPSLNFDILCLFWYRLLIYYNFLIVIYFLITSILSTICIVHGKFTNPPSTFSKLRPPCPNISTIPPRIPIYPWKCNYEK